MPNMYYRDDIGERWIDGGGDRLQAWGYLGPAKRHGADSASRSDPGAVSGP